MIKKDLSNPKYSFELFELDDKFNFLTKLYNSTRFPNVLLLSGKKGIGKSTLINHFLSYVFDNENYVLNNKIIDSETSFYQQHLNNIFPNIIYLEGAYFKNVKVDDIRSLKTSIFKTSLSKKKRFIVLDDVELFNTNSLNALLKIIEDPPANNHFILINNKSRPLIDTIRSRSLEVNISLTGKLRIKITQLLIKKFSFKNYIDIESYNLTPGNYLIFNNICEINKINIKDDFLHNFKKLIILYKKNKDINLINMVFFLNDLHFHSLFKKDKKNIDRLFEKKSLISESLNKFVLFNLNQNTLINNVNAELSNG